MKKILSLARFFIYALFAVSCSDVLLPQGAADDASTYETRTLTLNFEAAPQTTVGYAGTKAVQVDVEEGVGSDYMVRDFVLFQFDENGELLGNAKFYQYTEGMQIPVILPPTNDLEYTCYILANSHDPTLPHAFSEVTSESQLLRKCVQSKSLQTMYRTDNSGDTPVYDLLMHGRTTVTRTISNFCCTLYRNVAKLTFVVRNPQDSDLTINNMKVRGVSSRIDYFDRFTGASGIYPTNSGAAMFDYGQDELEIAPGRDTTIVYYVPRNMRGTNSNTLGQQMKNHDAPQGALRAEVIATRISDQASARYTFYPGMNMTNDFNVIPNYNYVIDMSFNSIGDPSVDTRVETWPGVNVLEYSNCYIINPAPGESQPLFKIPVARRVNEYWEHEGPNNGVGYTISATGGIGGNGDTWTAEVVWQDRNFQLIQFCDGDGSITADNGCASPQYQGQVTLNFRPLPGACGNVVVGIRRGNDSATDGYLWSWHLWITDYNPDRCSGQVWTAGSFTYTVPGGEVHHYVDAAAQNPVLWGEGGIYENRWIMDRNIGATDIDDPVSDWEGTRGLYYQFGRKDPFKMSNTTYRIDGTRGTSLTSLGGNENKLYTRCVNNPGELFRGLVSENQGDWLYINPYLEYVSAPVAPTDIIWNNPEWYYLDRDGGSTTKSLFDPCPPGWHLPLKGFASGIVVNGNETAGQDGYYFSLDGNMGASRMWFPLTGMIFGQYHTTYDKKYCSLTSASPQNATTVNVVGSSGSKMGVAAYSVRAYAFPARCIQE